MHHRKKSLRSIIKTSNKSKFDFIQFFEDHNIDYKHTNGEWVNINCPILGCKYEGYKGGCNVNSSFYTCFRCGRHSKFDLVSSLLNLPDAQVLTILKQYSSHDVSDKYLLDEKAMLTSKTLKTPLGLTSVKNVPVAYKYLLGRGLDPDMLEEKYEIQATRISDFPHRIYIPVIYNGYHVSYTTRSYREDIPHAERYISCDGKYELMDHKSLLYNYDNTGDTVVVVEGPADVWNMGDGFVASFGNGLNDSQIKLLKNKKKVFILYDNEPLAQQIARRACEKVSFFTDCENLEFDSLKDPGEFNKEEVKFIREMIFNK